MENIILKASWYARQAHEGQKRKYNNTPYWLHPARVAGLVSGYTDDERVVAAAWLHDVAEDTANTCEDISKEFGKFVADNVFWLTKLKLDDVARFQRMQIYHQQLTIVQRAAEDAAHNEWMVAPSTLIKLADRYDNLRELDHEDDFYKLYVKETHHLLDSLDVGHELVDLIKTWIGPKYE